MEVKMSFKNILIPLDGSALAEKALQYVATIADAGATLHLLSIVTEDKSLLTAIAMSGTYGGGLVTDDLPINPNDPRLIHERQDYLDKVAEPLRQQGYVVTVDARPGNVVQSIIELARDRYDAIVMVNHGRTGLSKALLGSVAQSVVVKSPCPVVLIPAQSPDSANFLK
jgi:nucleotide-binding universal stress UspA family protein